MRLIGKALAQQAVDVLVAAALPAAIRIGTGGLNSEGMIDCLKPRELLAVVHRQSTRTHP